VDEQRASHPRAESVVAVVLGPAVDLRLGLVLRDAVALLDLAGELVLLAVDDVEVVVGAAGPTAP
jgi:hypothetical protein